MNRHEFTIVLTGQAVAVLMRERAARMLEDLTLDEFIRLVVIERVRAMHRQPHKE